MEAANNLWGHLDAVEDNGPWRAVPNHLIGGWAVISVPVGYDPDAFTVFRGSDTAPAVLVADFSDQAAADLVAHLYNEARAYERSSKQWMERMAR